MGLTPQRFTPRGGSSMPGRVRRSLDGGVDSERRFASSLSVQKDGRLGARLARNSGLEETRQGLRINKAEVGEKNRPMLNTIRDPESGATAADLRVTMIELLREMRRTGRMR